MLFNYFNKFYKYDELKRTIFLDCGENEVGELQVAKHKRPYDVTISSSSPKPKQNCPPIMIVVVHGMLYCLCQLYFVIKLIIFGL